MEFPSLLQVCPTFPVYQASLSMGQSPYHSLSFSTEQAPRFQYVVKILTAVDSTNGNLTTFLVYSSDPAQGFQSLTAHAFLFLLNISCIKIGCGWERVTDLVISNNSGMLKQGQQRPLGMMAFLYRDIIQFIATSTDLATPQYFVFPAETCYLHALLTPLDFIVNWTLPCCCICTSETGRNWRGFF